MAEKKNGAPQGGKEQPTHARMTVTVELATGATEVDLPTDPLLAAKMLQAATAGVVKTMEENRKAALRTAKQMGGVQVHGAGQLRHLNGGQGANGR